jgi:hypothetical protein
MLSSSLQWTLLSSPASSVSRSCGSNLSWDIASGVASTHGSYAKSGWRNIRGRIVWVGRVRWRSNENSPIDYWREYFFPSKKPLKTNLV